MNNEEQIAAKAAEDKKRNNLINLEGELKANLDDGVQGIARDHFNESMFNPDDFVVLRNPFDGGTAIGARGVEYQMPQLRYEFTYNSQTFAVNGGQTFRLPGSQAYVFIKHIISLIYRRIEGNDDMDKRTYDVNDPWVQNIVVQVDETLSPEGVDKSETVEIPAYMASDENLAKNIGNGESALPTQIDDADATSEQIDSTPDFDPKLNPRLAFDKDGQALDGKPEEEVAFPDAKKARQSNK